MKKRAARSRSAQVRGSGIPQSPSDHGQQARQESEPAAARDVYEEEPGRYWSASKKKWLLIADMPSAHLMNAWRKLIMASVNYPHMDKKADEIENELGRRGFIFDGDSGQWSGPPPAEPEVGLVE